MEEGIKIPAGYVQDARGNLVKKSNVKPLDLRRDVLVRRLYKKAKEVAGLVESLKREAQGEIEALIGEGSKEHGVRLGGKKGNVQLTSYDGSIRVLRARAESITFSEQLEVARSLVHECLQDYSKGASKNLKALVENAFQIDDKGNVSVTRVLALRRVQIDDEKWQKAMHIIAESMQVVASKEYIRFYERKEDGEYELMPLSIGGA